MDEIDLDEQYDDYGDDSLYQACYVYRSATARDVSSHQPKKRRKLSHDAQPSTEWPRLPEAIDTIELAEKRQALLDAILRNQQEASNYRNGVNEQSIGQLLPFIQKSKSSTIPDHIAAALLLTGLDSANYDVVLAATTDRLPDPETTIIISIQSRQCPNLQTALKNIIKATIVTHSDTVAYHDFLTKHKRFFPLNFDLELLERFTQQQRVEKLVISLSDVENMDGSTINDMINTMYLWRNRIPCVFLLGITSTRELFEHRLSKSCLKHLHARTFDFAPQGDQMSDFLRTAQVWNSSSDAAGQLFLGPSVVKALHDLSQTQGHTAQSLSSTIRYLYISHYIASPVSIFSATGLNLQNQHSIKNAAEIARSAPSFRQFCDDVLEQRTKKASDKVKTLLNDDEYVLSETRERVAEGARAFASTCSTISSFSSFCQVLSQYAPKLKKPRLDIESQLYQALNDLTDCQVFDDVRDCLHDLDQVKLGDVLYHCDGSLLTSLGLDAIAKSLQDAGPGEAHVNGIAKAPATMNTPTSKATKLAKMNSASTNARKQKTKPISSFAQDLISALERKLQDQSLDITSCLLHESYILSSHAIHFKQNFESQPRAAIERALLRPGDYLTCDCCSRQDHASSIDDREDGDKVIQEGKQARAMPPVCTLFTLLQEAPTIVNVRDLFDAFSSHLGNSYDQSNDDETHTALKNSMTLFYRALAELKMLGFVKASTGTQVRKRTAGGRSNKSAAQDVDFIAKTAWSGL